MNNALRNYNRETPANKPRSRLASAQRGPPLHTHDFDEAFYRKDE
jgi:hypothetical protein